MKLRNIVAGASLAVAFCFGGVAAQAATYANTNDVQIFSFGSPDTTSYGQVFTAPGGALQSWSFFDGDASTDGAALVIASWNGSSPVGPALYRSLSQTVTTDPSDFNHTFSGINLSLTAGSQYIAYLTVAGVANPTSDIGVNGSTTSPLGGNFYYLNSGGADPLQPPYAGQPWDSYFVPDLQYSATFGSAVPEPATWAMLMLGVAAVGFAARRRREGMVLAA